jgi:hypothetical protein
VGRNRKFDEGDRVHVSTKHVIIDGVIVDYRQDDKLRGEYRVQRQINNWAAGPPVWQDTWTLTGTSGVNRRLVNTYRKNLAIPDRGCKCNCCVHVAVPLGEVRLDGTFKGDDETTTG